MAIFQKRGTRWRAIVRKKGHPTQSKSFTIKLSTWSEKWLLGEIVWGFLVNNRMRSEVILLSNFQKMQIARFYLLRLAFSGLSCHF